MTEHKLRPAFQHQLQKQINLLKDKGTQNSYITMELQHMLEDNYEQYEAIYGEYCIICARKIVKEMVEEELNFKSNTE